MTLTLFDIPAPRHTGAAEVVVDTFAGPGGWEEGLRDTGHDGPSVGIEWDSDAVATATAAGHDRITADVAAHPVDAFGTVAGYIGSPPCPGFSNGGDRRGHADLPAVFDRVAAFAAGRTPADVEWSDWRSPFTAEPMRWIIGTAPRWVALEQVPAVAPVWAVIGDHLRAAGFDVWSGIVDAADYGTPQHRRRAVLVASRDHAVTPPAITHGPRGDAPHVTMADALGWGMTARPYYTLASSRHTGGPDREKVGGSGARKALYAERDAGRWIDPATPEHDGAIRVRIDDAARLQGFRPGYPWHGTATSRFRQVTNAVPPPLAAAVLSVVTGPAHPAPAAGARATSRLGIDAMAGSG